MPVDLNDLRALASPAGKEALQAAMALAPYEVDFLRHLSALSRAFSPSLARPALEIAILRGEASSKFPAASRMFFIREALEQASTFAISAYRAERYRPFPRLVDLGCSIGGDTLALAAIAPTAGVDIDPLRLAMAKANLEACGLAGRAVFIQADLRLPLPISSPVESGGVGLFFDPARRTSGRRVSSVRGYRPPLAAIQEWLNRFPALGVKVSPAVKLEELGEYQAEVEFISLKGALKEAVLWFGPLKTAQRRATLLPGAHTLTEKDNPTLPLSEPLDYIYEPDAAVLRAGLVGALGARLDAAQLDPEIAYLTAHDLQPTPFARAWAVEDWFPFGLKRLRAYLRERGIGQVVVKKRGSPLNADRLAQQLRRDQGREAVVFLTMLRGRPIVIVAKALP